MTTKALNVVFAAWGSEPNSVVQSLHHDCIRYAVEGCGAPSVAASHLCMLWMNKYISFSQSGLLDARLSKVYHIRQVFSRSSH